MTNHDSIKPGDGFDRWTVLSRDDNPKDRRKWWLCQCKCGTVKSLRDYTLSGRMTKSCGCLRREVTIARSTRHGACGSKTHRTWKAMIYRCSTKSNKSWKNYGGRGITVCDRWKGKQGFQNFLADMGKCPSESHSIDRIDNDKGYSPENCRWATHKEQMRNTRMNKLLTLNGKTQCAAAWAEELRICKNTIRNRRNRGLPIEKVLERTK